MLQKLQTTRGPGKTMQKPDRGHFLHLFVLHSLCSLGPARTSGRRGTTPCGRSPVSTELGRLRRQSTAARVSRGEQGVGGPFHLGPRGPFHGSVPEPVLEKIFRLGNKAPCPGRKRGRHVPFGRLWPGSLLPSTPHSAGFTFLHLVTNGCGRRPAGGPPLGGACRVAGLCRSAVGSFPRGGSRLTDPKRSRRISRADSLNI